MTTRYSQIKQSIHLTMYMKATYYTKQSSVGVFIFNLTFKDHLCRPKLINLFFSTWVPCEPVRQFGVASVVSETENFQHVVEDQLFLLRCGVRQPPSSGNFGQIFLKHVGIYITLLFKQFQPACFVRMVLSSSKRSFVEWPKICRPQLGFHEYPATAIILRPFNVSNETVDLVEVCYNQV